MSAAAAPTHAIARAASIVGHPMALLPAAIALAMRGRVPLSQAAVILAVVFAVIVIVGVYLVHGVRSGRLSHVDVSKREERGTFYGVSMLATFAAAIALWLGGAPRAAAGGAACAFALLVVSSVVNRWIKTSLHTAFAVVAAGIVGPGVPLLFAGFLVVAAIVAWSRVALGRHSLGEVGIGAVLGTVTSVALQWSRTL